MSQSKLIRPSMSIVIDYILDSRTSINKVRSKQFCLDSSKPIKMYDSQIHSESQSERLSKQLQEQKSLQLQQSHVSGQTSLQIKLQHLSNQYPTQQKLLIDIYQYLSNLNTLTKIDCQNKLKQSDMLKAQTLKQQKINIQIIKRISNIMTKLFIEEPISQFYLQILYLLAANLPIGSTREIQLICFIYFSKITKGRYCQESTVQQKIELLENFFTNLDVSNQNQEASVKDFISQFVKELLKKASRKNVKSLLLITYQSMLIQTQFDRDEHTILQNLSLAAYNQLFQFCTSFLIRFQNDALAKSKSLNEVSCIFLDSLKISIAIFDKLNTLGFFSQSTNSKQISHRLIQFFVVLLSSNFAIFHTKHEYQKILTIGLKHMNEIVKTNQLKKLHFYRQEYKSIQSRQFLFLALIKIILYIDSESDLSKEIQVILLRMIKQKLTLLMVKNIFCAFYFTQKSQSKSQKYNFSAVFRVIQSMQNGYNNNKLKVKKFISKDSYIVKYLNKQDFPCKIIIQLQSLYFAGHDDNYVLDLFCLTNQKSSKVYSIVIKNYSKAIKKQNQRLNNKKYVALQIFNQEGQLPYEINLRQIDSCAEVLSFEINLNKSSVKVKCFRSANSQEDRQPAKQIQNCHFIQKVQFGKNPYIQPKQQGNEEIHTNGMDQLKLFQVHLQSSQEQVSESLSMKTSQTIKDRLNKKLQNIFSRNITKEDKENMLKNIQQYSLYSHLKKIGGIDALVILLSYLLKTIEDQNQISLIINKFALLSGAFQQRNNGKMNEKMRMKYILCLIYQAVRFSKSTKVMLNIFDQFFMVDDIAMKQQTCDKNELFQKKNQKIIASFLELLCNFNIWRKLDIAKCNEIVSKINELFDGFSSMKQNPTYYQFHQSTVIYLSKKILFDGILMNQDPELQMNSQDLNQEIRFTGRIGDLICNQVQKLISTRYYYRKSYQSSDLTIKKPLKKSKGLETGIIEQKQISNFQKKSDSFQNLLINFFHFLLDVIYQLLKILFQKAQNIQSSNKNKQKKSEQQIYKENKLVVFIYFQFQVATDVLQRTTAHFCKRNFFTKVTSQQRSASVQQKIYKIIQQSKFKLQKQYINKAINSQSQNESIKFKQIYYKLFKCYTQILYFQGSLYEHKIHQRKVNSQQIAGKTVIKIKQLQIIQRFSKQPDVLRALLQVLFNNELCIQIASQLLQTIDSQKIQLSKAQIFKMLKIFLKLKVQDLKQDKFNFSCLKPFLRRLQTESILQKIKEQFERITKQRQLVGKKDKRMSSHKNLANMTFIILFLQQKFHIKNCIEIIQTFRPHQETMIEYLQSILIFRYIKQTIILSQQSDLQQHKKQEATFFETSNMMMMNFLQSFGFIKKKMGMNSKVHNSTINKQEQGQQGQQCIQKIANIFKILQQPRQSERISELKKYQQFIQEDLLKFLNKAIEQIIYRDVEFQINRTVYSKQIEGTSQVPTNKLQADKKGAQQLNRQEIIKKIRKESESIQKEKKPYQTKALLSLPQFVIHRRQQLSEIPKLWKKIRQNNRFFWKLSQTNQIPPDFHLDPYCNALKQKVFLSEQTQRIQVKLPRIIDISSSKEISIQSMQKAQKFQKRSHKQKLKQQRQFFYQVQDLKSIKNKEVQMPAKKNQQKKKHQWKIGLVRQDKTIQGILEVQINSNAGEKRKSYDKLTFRQLDYIDQQLHKLLYIHKSNQRTNQEIVNYKVEFQIRIDKVRKIMPKKYLQHPVAVQILSEVSCHFFLFQNKYQKQQFVSLLKRKSHIFKLLENNLLRYQTDKWRNGIITNFQYLMILNDFSGRSFNDTSQYYVFPWTVTNFQAEKFDQQFLRNEANFRNLSYPIGKINEQRFKGFLKRYHETLKSSFYNMVPFLYGSFFSNSAVVSNFLIRISQFSMNHFLLQNNQFDIADRLFFSVIDQYDSTYSNFSDLKELVPEFYSNWEFLLNRNNYQFGKRQGLQQKTVHHVQLPRWVKTGRPEQFVFKMRKALQCNKVKSQLSKWIDLIFGKYNQRQFSKEKDNLYNSHVYPCNSNDLQDEQLDSYLLFYKEFGQMPSCLFREDHEKPKQSAYQDQEIKAFKDAYQKNNSKQTKTVASKQKQTSKIVGSKQIRFNLNIVLYSVADQIIYASQNLKTKQSWKSIKELKERNIQSFDIMESVSNDFTPQITVFYVSQGDLYLSHIRKVISPFSEYKSTVPIAFPDSLGSFSLVRTLNQYLIAAQGSNLKIYVHRADPKSQDGDEQYKALQIPQICLHLKKQFTQHSSDIIQLQINTDLSLVTSIDRMGKVFMLHIGSIISVRSFFDIKQIEFSQKIKKIIVHSMGFLIILTSQNRILLYNYFGQVLVNVLVKFRCYSQKCKKITNQKMLQDSKAPLQFKKIQQKLVQIQLWSQQSMDIILATSLGQLWRLDLFDLSLGGSDFKQVMLPHQQVDYKVYQPDILFGLQGRKKQYESDIYEQIDRNKIQSLKVERFGVHWKIHCILCNGKTKTTESPNFSSIKKMEYIHKRIQTD